ncbi:hypothetical protein RBG61_00485 [Paludicola sp. MB14-C6]|uniref:hypothetical protein n=1 Tax=Paludihabitans sp. MB14-C6 TaxID=3070656 RepID=UPI0027DC9A1C|nr:hypothetical protein [Paludicola sp. MB14-C6]WMJ23167.1 hypothetical protein RBG61_00485 [Paludicola sp. MB14-C6]
MFQDPSGRYQVPASIQMAGPATVASYLAGIKKNDPCNQAKAAVVQKKKEAEMANAVINNPLYQPTSSSSSTSSSSGDSYTSSETSSSNNWSSGIDYGQAEAQRKAEEAQRRQAEIEKKKRDANFKACTSLINPEKYAQEYKELLQKESKEYNDYINQFKMPVPTPNPAVREMSNLDSLVWELGQKWKDVIVEPTANLINDIKNLDVNNSSEEAVLNANYISMYKGQTVIRADLNFNGNRSGSFGIMILDKKEGSVEFGGTEEGARTVKHEYGHFVQLQYLGTLKYIKKIAIPSVSSKATHDEYYSQPWERSADIFGGVQRPNYPYAEGSAEQSLDYLIGW